MSSDTAIHVAQLSKCYQIYDEPRHRLFQMFARGRKKFFREFWALRDVSFEVKKGETIGVIGRNGSGKSTLLQLLCGTLTPTSGKVEVNGRVAALLELGAGFNPEFTGRENARLNMAIQGMAEADINSRLDAVLNFAEIGEFIDQPVKTYSSGMYVRLAFSVAIHVEPEILIVDEALAVGDFAFQFKCLKKLKELSDSGVTILFVTHDITQVQKLCSRALYLKRGQQVYFGDTKTAADLYFSDIAIVEPGMQDSADVSHVVAHHQIAVDEQLYADFRTHVAQYRRGNREQGELLYVTLNGTFKDEPSIGYGDSIEIEIGFRLTSALPNATIAFYVIDEAGQFIVGSNSYYEGIVLSSGEPGQTTGRFSISFENRLRSGRYGLQVYLVDFVPGRQTDYVDYIDLAARFAVFNLPGRERWALYTPPFSVALDAL